MEMFQNLFQLADLERRQKEVVKQTGDTKASSDELEQKLKETRLRHVKEAKDLESHLKSRRLDLNLASEESQRVEARLYAATQERDEKRR